MGGETFRGIPQKVRGGGAAGRRICAFMGGMDIRPWKGSSVMAFYDEASPTGGIRLAGVIATDDEEAIDRAARAAEARRIRANVLEEALANAPETDGAATIESRRGGDGVSRLYAVDGGGRIVAPTNRERPFSEEEWAALDRAARSRDLAALGELYGSERRTQGVGYAESGLLDGPELRRRREAAFGDRGTESLFEAARAARIRRAFAEERAYGNGPSERQMAAKRRWDAAREAGSRYPNDRRFRREAAEGAQAHSERLAEANADSRLALARQQGLDARALAEIERKGALSLEELRGLSQRQLQALVNRGNLAVAEAEGRSRVAAAEATASGVRDAGLAKAQAEEEARQREARGRLGQDLLTYVRLGGSVDPSMIGTLALASRDAEDLQRRIEAAKAAGGGSPELAKQFYDQVIAPQLGAPGTPSGAPGVGTGGGDGVAAPQSPQRRPPANGNGGVAAWQGKW